MTDPNDIDLHEEDKPTWEKPYFPPPWSAEPAADFGQGDEPEDAYVVLSFGYDDETPTVCAGTKAWPLFQEQAQILAASLETLAVCRRLDEFWTEDFKDGPDGKDAQALTEETRALWKAARAAVAKAEGKDQ